MVTVIERPVVDIRELLAPAKREKTMPVPQYLQQLAAILGRKV